MIEEIRHSGIIESQDHAFVRVRIQQTSACAACKVASHCNASESKEKIIDVPASAVAVPRRVGDAVEVCVARRSVRRALVVSFVVPFLLMVLTLFAVLRLSGDEATAGLASLAVLLPYYLAVWLLRERIGRQVSFYIAD